MIRLSESITPFTWACQSVFSFCVDFIRPALQVLGPQALARVLPGVLVGQLALSSVLVSREIGGLPTRTGLRGMQKTLPQQGSLGTVGSRRDVSLTVQDSAPSLGFIRCVQLKTSELNLLPVSWTVGRMEPKRNCERSNGSSTGGGAEAEGRVPGTGETNLPPCLSRAGGGHRSQECRPLCDSPQVSRKVGEKRYKETLTL